MKRLLKLALGLGFLVVGGVVVKILIETMPEAEKRKDTEIVRPVVDMVEVKYQERTLVLPSQGVIEAKQRTMISAEVSGRVVSVSPRFDVGQSFRGDGSEAGEVLICLDKTDYEAAKKTAELAVADAKLAVADAELNFETEQAKAAQALKDWESLGEAGKKPSTLTLREPQLKKARAAMDSAQATLAKAEADRLAAIKDLDRTEIKAPFDGVLSRAEVEVGAFVSPGTPVAEIYSQAPFEVRLPLALRDYDQLQRDDKGQVQGQVAITIQSASGDRELKARLVRNEGEVDRRTRSIYVVAQIEDGESDPLLQPGLFIKAEIQGKTFPRLAPIPFRSFEDSPDEVVFLRPVEPKAGDESDQGNLFIAETRRVDVVRREDDIVWIDGGLEEGDRVAWTQLPQFSSSRELDTAPPNQDHYLEGGNIRPWPPAEGDADGLPLDEGLSVTKP